MSRDNSSFRPVSRIISSSANDNKDFVTSLENSLNHEMACPPPPYHPHSPGRTPLNSIPDPSQIQSSPPSSPSSKEKLARTLLVDGQQQQHHHLIQHHTREREPARACINRVGVKVSYSEPNSAQSTPVKSHRVSNVGGKGGGGSCIFSRYRGGGVLQIGNVEPVVEAPHYELAQDHSFWKDYNVQVLIRIRPLSNVEKVSQGYARCLRQESAKTLVWQGHPETRFTFDHIACETISQEKLFTVAGLPMVENCMSGYNSCMFAYGQTGSGKTYTMMGDISRATGSGKLNEDCGITPRIFEYLFTRIREEENKRRNEGLKYSCKCSFLEIYNEQITDLLEPSSINLQLREDLKKGVYVESLTDYSVSTVDDVLRLLLQGAANRKMAATHMNSESSRSHSVFTCIIESRWEKDSMTHLRFGRLNLVDLAGSERQKTSGAEGERLKEAANINKSLSTLGLVIMSLVDLAQGKQRHVPYRDSRLTFLLQDSLGGNSKTTIIANVSSSLCSANETLSTLKFAQRAKLIQNNARVNEDASGDVMALQQQIQQLKGQLSMLLNHSNSSKDFSHPSTSFKGLHLNGFLEGLDPSDKLNPHHGMQTGIGSKVQVSHVRSHSTDEFGSCILPGDGTLLCDDDQRALVLHSNDVQKELIHARSLIEAMESKQIGLIEELESLRQENHNLREMLQDQVVGANKHGPRPGDCNTRCPRVLAEDLNLTMTGENQISQMMLQAKLEKLSKDLSEAQLLNHKYLEDHTMELLHNQQTQLVQAEVEIETSKTILHLQEEIAMLHSELQGRLHSLEEENGSLRNCLAAKESELKALCSDWERATFELTTFLLDGSKSLKDASSQIESITSLFPCDNVCISEHVQRAAKLCVDKEESTLLLRGSLEDAQRTVSEMEQKFKSLRDATIAVTEIQQMNNFENNLMFVESNVDCERHPEANLLGLKGDSDEPMMVLRDNVGRYLPFADGNALESADVTVDIELTCLKLSEAILEDLFASIQSDIGEAFSMCHGLVHSLGNDIRDIRRNFDILKVNYGSLQTQTAGNPFVHSYKLLAKNEDPILHQIRDELIKVNERMNLMIAHVSGISNECETLAKVVNTGDEDGWTTDFSTSSYDSSIEVALRTAQYVSIGSDQKNGQTFVQEFEEGSLSPDNQQLEQSKRLVQNFSFDGALLFHLRKEFREAYDAFGKIDAQLTAISSSKGTWDGSVSDPCIHLNEEQCSTKDVQEQVTMPETGLTTENHEEMMRLTYGGQNFTRESNRFFTKFEGVEAIMKEADCMLNALLRSNEDAKHLTSIWRQAGSHIMMQRENLVEEIKQLSSSIHVRESTNELLQDQMHFILKEMTDLMFLLEGSFQRDVEDLWKIAYSDAILSVKETLNNISSLRSLVEAVSSMVKKDGIISLLLHHSYLGEDSNEGKRLDKNLNLFASSIDEVVVAHIKRIANADREECQIEAVQRLEAGESGEVNDDLVTENLELTRELERKKVLLKGLLFDLSLLQESVCSKKDAKDEVEKLTETLSQVQNELKRKANQLDNMLIRYATLEGRLTATENALSISNYDLDQVRGSLDGLSEKNAELRVLLKDLYQKKSEAEQLLQEQTDTITDLENEILRMASSAEENLASSLKDIKDDMAKVTIERDILLDQVHSLQEKLDIACALADEKEAIILETRQDSEASKEYAEQKEEEVKILEHSVEELESTINVLEKKVYEMDEEVERHHEVRDSLEMELHDMRKRLLMVENMTEDLDSRSSSGGLSSNISLRKLPEGSMELCKAYNQIRILEKEKEKLFKEIKQYREYVSELVMHAEAQASQYQQKYKNLELMVNEVTTDTSKVMNGAPTLEKTSVKPRGSSSPFRCISNLVQQMNLEKEQELSVAQLRIEELEALVASQQKEVCLLNTRLASVESMTHDVIRDLLGVKLDITNYSDLVSENQLQKLVEGAQQQAQQYMAMEKEIVNLRRQINDLVEERESGILEANKREADALASRVALEQVRERDQLLTAQNEMLKADKTKLQRKIAELDDMVKKILIDPYQRGRGRAAVA